MTQMNASAGYFHSGMPYNRSGHGPRTLVVFQGLWFENKPLPKFAAGFVSYGFLKQDYTIYLVTRKPGLPAGCSMRDMADDYASMIEQEFGGPVDVIGISTGGSIAQHFAADHPDLVRRLIIHSSAYKLGCVAKDVQLHLGHLAGQGRWQAVFAELMGFMHTGHVERRAAVRPLIWLESYLMLRMMGAPDDPSDFIATVEAEDRHDFKDCLSQISAPTLVAAGDHDPFYTEALFRETAEGIPGARLILYRGQGHPASGAKFRQDVREFLLESEQ